MELLNAAQVERRLDDVMRHFREIEDRMAQPDVARDPVEFRKLATQHSELSRVSTVFGEYKRARAQLEGARSILASESDAEMLAMAEAERDDADARLPGLLRDLQLLLIPKDPLDEKNVILEIRAGTGGEEAALFAADLFRMYSRLADRLGWSVELIQETESATGGFREIIASVAGASVYSRLKFESGVHRVQRVPDTEAQGRIHTSAATVAVLPEAEELDLEIKQTDLRIDVYRSGGKGGQGVNTTDSAVRITHLPSGLVVTCQDERSQIKNRAKAMKVLAARLLDMKTRHEAETRASARKSMVGSGDRSERIRTYNYPQNRLTDHRINLTLYSLDRVMEGGLDDLIDALALEDQAAKLQGEESMV